MNVLIVGAVTLLVIDAGVTRASDIVDSILAGNRHAVGNPSPMSEQSLKYDYAGSGLVGTRTLHVDLTTGAYVETTNAGGVTEGNGFDGVTAWQRDVSGAYTPQQGGDRTPMAITRAYQYANGWWLAARDGATIASLSDETARDRLLNHLSVTPRLGKRFDAWFDSKTDLLVRIAYDEGFQHVIETYSDYRREGQQMLAHRIEIDPGLGKSAVSILTLSRFDYGPAAPLSAYSLPNEPLLGVDIHGGWHAATVPFRLLNNHIYVEARVNGKGPYTFIVDTGGHTLLSPRIIEQVGLKTVGEAVTSGAGEGHGTTGFVRYQTITMGRVRLYDQVGFSTPIYDKAVEGIEVDGMVGFELFRRLVVSIDYGRHCITFVTPQEFQPGPNTGVAVPFVFYDHVPNVAGRIDELPARFNIDTGSRSGIDVTTPFVMRNGLRARFPSATLAVTGFGVGGPTRSYVVRTSEAAIGDVPIRNPVVDLSDAHGGSFSDPNFDGNVGNALLKRFIVTFDYAHQMMYLRRITPAPPDLDTFDRSGLWINAHGNGYEVVDVARGSAGFQAGFQIGDLIVTVDGHPLTDSDLSKTRQALRATPSGSRIAITVQRGGQGRAVTLVLRDQL